MQATARNVAQKYLTMQAQTASGPKKILMLHERCVDLITAARLRDGGSRRRCLDLAQNILAQLQTALRPSDSVSQGLFYLYDYAYTQLERGEWTDMVNALAIIRNLRDTFRLLYLRMRA
jgi:flagellin-specific chaperone FliS